MSLGSRLNPSIASLVGKNKQFDFVTRGFALYFLHHRQFDRVHRVKRSG